MCAFSGVYNGGLCVPIVGSIVGVYSGGQCVPIVGSIAGVYGYLCGTLPLDRYIAGLSGCLMDLGSTKVT